MSASICKLEICSQKNIRIQVHTCSMMYFKNCYEYLIFDIPTSLISPWCLSLTNEATDVLTLLISNLKIQLSLLLDMVTKTV